MLLLLNYNLLLTVGGILGIVVGIVAFIWPGITTFVLLFLIAAWLIVTGIIEMVAAFTLPLGTGRNSSRSILSKDCLYLCNGSLNWYVGCVVFDEFFHTAKEMLFGYALENRELAVFLLLLALKMESEHCFVHDSGKQKHIINFFCLGDSA